jgi:hypothetical protein
MSLTTTTGRVAEAAAPTQEAVMGKAIPTQHPAVVLRSHFRHVRALLAIAMIAVVGLTVAVVILANDTDEVAETSTAKPIESLNYGGFNPSTGRPESAPFPHRAVEPPRQVHSPGQRYDGGPEEGTRGIVPAQPPATRYDGGPEEGTRGAVGSSSAAASPLTSRFDGGSPGASGFAAKDYSKNAATGDTATTESAPLSQRKLDGSTDAPRYDGGPEEGTTGVGR